jgi:hypothetical protein
MNLREARLCLDCEELHTAEQCPQCASEAFAFLTRWLPSDENAQRTPAVFSPFAAAPRLRHESTQ